MPAEKFNRHLLWLGLVPLLRYVGISFVLDNIRPLAPPACPRIHADPCGPGRLCEPDPGPA